MEKGCRRGIFMGKSLITKRGGGLGKVGLRRGEGEQGKSVFSNGIRGK